MNAIELRNLQEQVQKNKDDILKHFQRDEILADFGIHIIGQLDTEEELLALPTEGLEYGDAYAVGTQSPFNYYIWTRANNLSPVDYWFAFGEIAIAGPQGPKGDKGDKGATGQSTTWIAVFDLSYIDLDEQNVPLDTMVLEYSSGNVYQVLIVNGVKSFSYCLNIKGAVGPKGPKGDKGDTGATGPQGPKGDTGDVGGFINIAGIVNTEYDLPDPSLINNLTVAYLVGTAEPYNLYIQVGSNSRVAEWVDMGPLNVATYVSAGGVFQNVWNADTKLDKVSTTTGNNQAYVKSYNGTQSMVDIAYAPSPWKIASYDGDNHLKTDTPVDAKDCVNLEYFNENAGGNHWHKLDLDSSVEFGNSGVYNFPTELQGHIVNIIIEVDYHRFDDWSERNSTVFGPFTYRLPGRNLNGVSAVINGNTSDTEIINQKIELSSTSYGDIGFSYAPVNYTFTKDSSTDYYTPEYNVFYQDLGASFVKYP